MKRYVSALALTSVCLASAAHAQTIGVSGVPSGLGLAYSTAAVGVAGSYGPDRGGTNFDASGSLSFGFGDPVSAVGLQASANITSFRDFGESGYWSVGVHRMFQLSDRGLYSVAANASYISPWGDSESEDVGYSVVGTYLTSFGESLGMITLGAANDLNSDRADWQGIFGIGISIGENYALSLAQAGDTTTVGVSLSSELVSGNSLGFSVSNDPDTDGVTFTISLGRAFSLRGE